LFPRRNLGLLRQPSGGRERWCIDKSMESRMDPQTKHEIKLLALSTLAAIPVAAGIGFVVVSGLVAW
jgi:hypothetical protein